MPALLLLFFLLLIGLGASFTHNPHYIVLPNGLQVHIIESHRAPVSTQMLCYLVGGINDTDGTEGTAHFLEHLMFKETKHYPAGFFSKQVARFGGNDNAFTTYDYTCYHQTVGSQYLSDIMQLEAQRMRGLVFDTTQTETERNVILEERLSRIENSPGGTLLEKSRAALFKGSLYGRSLIGSKKALGNIKQNDLVQFYNRFYQPSNAILLLVGDITPKQARAYLTSSYYPIARAASLIPPAIAGNPTLTKPQTVTEKSDKIKTTSWQRRYIAPNLKTGTPSPTGLMLAVHLLASNETAYLYQKLVNEKELLHYIFGDYDPIERGPAQILFYGLVKEGVSYRKVGKSLSKALVEAQQDSFFSDELERVKNSILSDLLYASEDNAFLANIYIRLISAGYSPSTYYELISSIEKTPASEVYEALAWLSQNMHFITAVVQPND